MKEIEVKLRRGMTQNGIVRKAQEEIISRSPPLRCMDFRNRTPPALP